MKPFNSNNVLIVSPFIFFACPKKTKQKKRPLTQSIFAMQNQSGFPKFPTRIRKFLTETLPCAASKGRYAPCLILTNSKGIYKQTLI